MSARDFQSNEINNAYVLIGLARKNEINRRSKLSRLKQLVSAFLITTMLAVSVPAAPEVVVNGAKQTAQDVRFAWLSNSFAIESPWSLFATFIKRRGPTSNGVVTRIEVLPGAKTINKGEQITFAGIGYDSQTEIVNGVDVRWQVTDVGRNLSPRPLINSTFNGKLPGTFRVTATHASLQAHADVTVLPSPSGSTSSFNAEPISVSSRNSKRPSGKDSDENSSNLNPEDGMWNNENFPSSDDPGNQTGNPPGSPADGGAGNGNFQLSAPVLSLPGRGIDLALNLNYNSRLWNKSGNELTYDIDRGFPAPGWSLGFGKIMDMGANGGSMVIDADGTRHGYTGTIWPYGNFSIFRGFTTDGKFIDYNSYRDGTGIYSAWAYLPNGTYISYGAKGNNAVYPTYIRDANGNFITITYLNNQGPSIETITDTLGRVITFQYDSLGRFISAKAPRMQDEDPIYGGGKTRTLVKVHYRPLTLAYSFAGGITPMVREATVNVIDSIYYPATNTGYWFGGADSNHADYASYYSSYGMLAKVEEHRGMSWATGAEEQGSISAGTMTKRAEYNYPLTTTNEQGRTNGIGLNDAPTYETLRERWANRDVDDDAVTTYKIQQDTTPRVTTVIQPNGAVSRQIAHNTPNQFTDGLVYSDETLIPDPNGNVTLPNVPGPFKRVGQSNVTWGISSHVLGYQSPRPTYAEIFDENNKKVSTEYSYGDNPFNQITRSCDRGNNNELLRCTNATYENSFDYRGTWILASGVWFYAYGRHIFSLPLTTTIENSDGVIVSRTEYEYDNYTAQPLVNTPGVIQHDYRHDPYTTMTQDGECIQWQCGEINCGNTQPPDPAWYCVLWEQVSAFDPATNKRGNVTKTTTYSDAQAATGAIAETRGYDITGNLVKASSSCCEQTSIEYGPGTQYAYPLSQTRGSADINSPHRVTTSAVYDENTGLLKSSTDANGRTSTLNYNPDTLRPVKSTSSTGAYSTWDYDESAMTVTEEIFQIVSGSPVTAGKTKKYLNGLGLTIKEESYGPTFIDIVEAKYTKYAEPWKQSRPYRASDTPQWSEKFYDLQGRVTKVREPDGSETKAFYNEVAFPDSATNDGGNLPPGNTIRVQDAWGRERWGRYDQQQRLVEVVEPNPNGNGLLLLNGVPVAGSLVTKYSYDTLNRLTQTEQGGQLRKFKYDSLGRMTRQKLAEQTAILNDAGAYIGANQTGANWAEAFTYDNRSNLLQKTDARGVRTNFSYQISGADDPLNRIQSRSYDTSGPLDPGLTIHAASGVNYSYMTTGDKERISQIRTDGILTENFSYDGEGRVSHYTQTVDYRGDYEMKTSYLYDTLDRVKEVTYPAQYGLAGSPRKIVAHAYDTASRLTSLTYGTATSAVQQAGNIVYNASDQTTSINIGAAGANQVNEQYTFDPQTGLLTNQKAIKGATTLLDLSYDYNRNNSTGTLNGKTGHLTKIVDNINNNKNREYEFDAVGRLTKMKGGPTGNLSTQTYGYDRFGNRTNVTATGVAANNTPMPVDGIPNLPLTFNASNNRITTDGFQYDSAGNQTRALGEDGIWLKYEYDAANRLRVVKHDDGSPNGVGKQAFMYGSTNARLIDYDYNVGLNRLFASVGGTTLNEYTEYAGAVPTWTKSYTYLGDSQLSTITPNGAGGEAVEYDHPDRLGNRLKTNPTTGSVSEQAHLPFGRPLNAETSQSLTANNKRFTSYDRSAATGIDYAVNRTYDSKQGRFTQVDPIGMRSVSLVNPQTLNLYAYCANDPVNHTDPSGLGFFSFLKKLFKWVVRILKWVVIAIAVVLLAALILAYTPYMLPAFLGDFIGSLLGVLAQIGAAAFGTGLAGAIGIEVGATVGSMIAAGVFAGALTAVGAIANKFAQTSEQPKKNRGRYPCPPSVAKIVAQFSRLFKKLLEKESGHLTENPLENGGWVYQRRNGNLVFGRAEEFRRGSGSIYLDGPPAVKGGGRVIARVHTHPYKRSQQAEIDRIFKDTKRVTSGPSSTGPNGRPGDIQLAESAQMPSVVIYSVGGDVWSEVVGPLSIPDKNCKGGAR